MRISGLLPRLLISSVAAIGVAVVVVLVLTIVDLYLVGQILLACVFGAWCAAWLLLRCPA